MRKWFWRLVARLAHRAHLHDLWWSAHLRSSLHRVVVDDKVWWVL